jgi:hypothetical protein
MRYALKLHPHSPCDAVTAIEVEAARTGEGGLLLTYVLTGNLEALRIPKATLPERRDRLWEHGCFEAFIRAGAGPAYYEFNFAPSTQWAAYRLEDYRSGMTPIALDPSIEIRSASQSLELSAAFQLPPDAGAGLGLSAVIEDKNGRKSYWALAHPPGEPDFHHKDCFAAELPEMRRP